MRIIDTEQYDILKDEYYSEGYLWIARDMDWDLKAYRTEPTKGESTWEASPRGFKRLGYSLCTFVSWNDENPTLISELLHEYELLTQELVREASKKLDEVPAEQAKELRRKQEGETEINKGQLITKEEYDFLTQSKIADNYNWIARDGVDNSLWAYQTKPYRSPMRSVWNTEDKGAEWLYSVEDRFRSIKSGVEEPYLISALISEYEENALSPDDKIILDRPTLPSFVAEWMKSDIRSELRVNESITSILEEPSARMCDWVRSNINTYVTAYITEEFNIVDPKFYVLLPSGEYLTVGNDYNRHWFAPNPENIQGVKYIFTEEEIEEIDPRYLAFKEPEDETE